MYYGLVPPLATSVLAYIRKQELLRAGDRVAVAVSGGADSVALVRLLLELREELGILLAVVHFNHQLRGADSDADAQFVSRLAEHHKLDFHSGSADTAAYAAEKQLSTETAARDLRYQYFRRLLEDSRFNRVATAHTRDDQAETVLLKLVRGAGSRGLAGIYPRLALANQRAIVRPLLATRRMALETYLQSTSQSWREDASNRDLRYARNRVRHGILPRLERDLNSSVGDALAETAEIARAEEAYWQRKVARLMPKVWTPETSGGRFSRDGLAALPLALQRRMIRAASESVGLRSGFRHVEDIVALLQSDSRGVELPGGWHVARKKQSLVLERKPQLAGDYKYRLPIPGSVAVSEIGRRISAVLVSSVEHKPDSLLHRALLGDELQVRNWRAGDRFWPAHTKAAKKIKELLSDKAVAADRKLWPVTVSAGQIVWVRGFPTPAALQPPPSADAILIQEAPLE